MGIEIATKEDLELTKIAIQAILSEIKALQEAVLEEIRMSRQLASGITKQYISAQAYMDAVGIKRWKFNRLVEGNKIQTIKKKRKIYVPVGEVERFFSDPSVQ